MTSFCPTKNVATEVQIRPQTITASIKLTKEYKQKMAGEIIFASFDHKNTDVQEKVDLSKCQNSLVGSLILAYNRHHNIILRAEDFWCGVMTQFSNYVNSRSEELRNKIVDFEGKKELVVHGDGNLFTADYGRLTVSMTEEIAANIKDPSIKEWIMPDFTTTTNNDKIVFASVMMAAMQKYFNYKFCLECGISKVTLLGTLEDYENLLNRLEKLKEFDLEDKLMSRWYDLLKPIFEELVNVMKGNANLDFWNKVCSHHGGGSGPSYISGWITAFCCFTEDGEWQGNINSKTGYPRIETGDIPSGIVTVPITVDDNGTIYKTMMMSGGCLTDKVDNCTLQPRLDFMLTLIDESKMKK